MKVQETIRRETVNIALGSALLTVLMLFAFYALSSFDLTVIIGAALGYIAAVLDFFLLGLTVQGAAEYQAGFTSSETEPENGQESEVKKNIRKRVRKSYYLRKLMLIGFAALGLTRFVNLVAVLVPMIFPKFVIQFRNFAKQLPVGRKDNE